MRKVFLSICFVVCASGASFAQKGCSESNLYYPRISHAINTATINRVDPKYPAAAQAVNVSGSVVVRVAVDREGNVKTVNVVCGHPLLRAAVVNAVKQWQFKPNFGWGDEVVFRNRKLKTVLWDLIFKFKRD